VRSRGSYDILPSEYIMEIVAEYLMIIHFWSILPFPLRENAIALGDLNNDGFDDFLGYSDSRGLNVWLGSDAGITPEPNVSLNPKYFGNAKMRGVKHGDFNGDGFSDVIAATYQGRRFAVWLGSENMGWICRLAESEYIGKLWF